MMAACGSPSGGGTDDSPVDVQPDLTFGGGGWHWGWGGWGCKWCGGGGHHHHDGGANISLSDSHGEILQTNNTGWSLTKTGTVNQLAKTITWTVTATQGGTTDDLLVLDGDLNAINFGTGSATIGNIVVNLQTKVGVKWVTLSSDVADATNGDGATVAHVVKNASTEDKAVFAENAASGTLSFMDRHTNTVFSLVPEVQVAPWKSERLLFSATFKNSVLGLADGTEVRAEVILSFGNNAEGNDHVTDTDVDINGNGIIDDDEAKVRSVRALFVRPVPATTAGNDGITVTDVAANITTTGDATFSSSVFNITDAGGTVTASYAGGAGGGKITNCANATAGGITDIIAGNPVTLVPPVHLQACSTLDVQPDHCTPGTTGCGWQDNELTTYGQAEWSGSGAAAVTLGDHFGDVYNGTPPRGFELKVGTGTFNISFVGAAGVQGYIPSGGPPAALDATMVDPTTTHSGVYGGDVVGLALDIDFNDAGFLPNSANVSFGDLTLCSMADTSLNGKSLRQLRTLAEAALGSGPDSAAASLDPVVSAASTAFADGTVTTFAQQHLVNGACP